MISPFEVLTGNLSGAQKLEYKENNNPAYEAPNGSAGARNYVTRYIGARRADGKTYFAVRRKSTAVLNNKTRMTMAILGSIAAIKSAIKVGHSTDWANLHSIYNYRMAHGGDEAGSAISFNKWLDYWLRRMLQYKLSPLQLTASGISVSIGNPFGTYDDNVLGISTSIFSKFIEMLSCGDGAAITIDGVKFFAPEDAKWKELKSSGVLNPNFVNMFTPVNTTQGDDAPVYFNGSAIYTAAGVAVKSDDAMIPNEKYTTIAPA